MSFLQFVFISGITAFVFICFIMCLICLFKIGRLSKNTDIDEISEKIEEYCKNIKQSVSENSGGAAHQIKNIEIPQSTLCKIGVVHFNAFPDVTGAISFAAAILNKNNSGIILTSIYGRDASNTYLREITNGQANIQLLKEEQEALERAINNNAV